MNGSQQKRDCSDEKVIIGLKTEAGKAFEQAVMCLYEICWPSVRAMVLQNSGSEADAEDLFQEAILSFLDNILNKGKEVESSIQAYFSAIARYQWLNELRRRPGKDAFVENMAKLETDEGMEELLEKERIYLAIEDCKADMTPQCREILDSIYQPGRIDMETLAERLRLANAHTARQTKHRCMQRLKDCVREKLNNRD